jgi:hypothetical protein
MNETETPASRKGKAGVPWCTVALLSGKCDGSAISDRIEHDIFVRIETDKLCGLKLQLSNIGPPTHCGMGIARADATPLSQMPASILAFALDLE